VPVVPDSYLPSQDPIDISVVAVVAAEVVGVVAVQPAVQMAELVAAVPVLPSMEVH
jgi:hypothetical protein